MSNKQPATIGLLVCAFGSEYDSLVWAGIQAGAKKAGAKLICFVNPVTTSSLDQATKLEAFYALADAPQLDGLIIHTGTMNRLIGISEVRRLCARFSHLPRVLLSQPIDNLPSIQVENYMVMRKAVAHLIDEHHCQRLAFVAGPENHYESNERLQAFWDVHIERGLSVDPSLIVHGNFVYDEAKRVVSELLDRGPITFDAIVVASDDMVLAVYDLLQTRGLRIPEDMRVIGFDDLDFSRYLDPPLTTIAQPIIEQCDMAAQVLVDLIKGKSVEERVILETRVVLRASCGCKPPEETQDARKARQIQWTPIHKQIVRLVEAIGRRLAAAQSLQDLTQVMDEYLPRLGIQRGYIAFFEEGDVELLRLFYAYQVRGTGSHPGELYPTKQLLPCSTWSELTDFAFVVELLHHRGKLWGVLILDGESIEPWLYESLRAQISQALNTIFLLTEIQAHADGLEQQVRARTARLEQLLSERSEWLSMVAHDMRNPLSVVQLGIQTLLRQRGKLTPEEIFLHLEKILPIVQRIGHQITHIVEVDRDKKNSLTINLSNAAISPIIHQVLAHYALSVTSKQIQLHVNLPAQPIIARTDPLLIQTMVDNLLSNALKFSPAGGTISIDLVADSETFTISVQDHGPGLTPEDQSLLFGRYTRLSARPTAGEASTGLGLYITKQMVDALQGTISASSPGPCKGSTFTICLPKTPAAHEMTHRILNPNSAGAADAPPVWFHRGNGA